ncbi:hypothetical protein [Microcoleus vaginatus]|uniref:hypothetical protein n=1 Tax=Microcoleus vaginatus TaxID=119532 RepID=UPI00168917FE|nr:hypothetical protein [Microcoleus sp. FACHB-84]
MDLYIFPDVADLQYEKLNRPVIETSIDKAWGFSTYFFHTLVKQRQNEALLNTSMNSSFRNGYKRSRVSFVTSSEKFIHTPESATPEMFRQQYRIPALPV